MATKKKSTTKTSSKKMFTASQLKAIQKVLTQLDYSDYKDVDYSSAEFRLCYNEIELHDVNVEISASSLVEDVISELKLLK